MCKSKIQDKQTNNKIHRVKPRTLKSTNVHLVSDEGQNLGTTDWETANKLFDGVVWTDSIDIFPRYFRYHQLPVQGCPSG